VGGRIVELLSSQHQVAEALMPWLLNGTLRRAERRRLEDHLVECAACRAELERQRGLASLYREATAAELELDGSAALARLSARLDGESAPAPERRGKRMLSGWRLVAALQFCALAALVWTVWPLRPASLADGTYRGLAASTAPVSGDAVVIFAVDATEVDVRHALQRARARIVDGPTVTGGYVLRFEGGDAERSLSALRREASVLRVEPLDAVGSPRGN
jgi:anti-sigma factor RsiW